MHLRSRKGAAAVEESLGEESRSMTLLQSIIDQESETTEDARPTDNRNHHFDANRHSRDKIAEEKILPSVKNCGDLRFARSLTDGRKPSNSSTSSRLSVSSGSSLRSSSESNRQMIPPPLQSPYESRHKQRMVTKYRELGRMLSDVMGPQNASLSREGWALPVQSYQTPRQSVRGHPLLLRSCFERSGSAGGGIVEDRGRLRSMRDKEEQDIEIVSEGSRTETPSVEIVSVVDEMEFPVSANSSGKRVTFNPEATFNEPFAGSLVMRWGDKSGMQGQDIEPIRRAKTDTSLFTVNRSRRNKENELRSKDLDEEENLSGRYSFSEKRNSSLDGQRRMQSLRRSGSRESPRRRFDRSFDGTGSLASSSGSMRRSRSPRSSRRMLASWSYPLWSDSIDQHILLTDHHLSSIGNVEIRKWLEQKNRLLRKQKREEKRLERLIQQEKSEKQREKNEHQREYQEKARLWMKERKRENLLKKRWSKQVKASTSESSDFRRESGDRETRRRPTELARANSLSRKKMGASQELERSTLKGKTVGAKSDRRLRAKSAPCDVRESSFGNSSVGEGRGGNKERKKRTACKEREKVDRENSKSGGVEDATNGHVEGEGRRARERSKAKGGKSLSKSVHLESTADTEKMHNKITKVKISSQSSKDRLDPQGSEFQETSSDVGDAEREVDISNKLFDSLRQDGGDDSDNGINKEDEESENGKEYEWKESRASSESERDDGESENNSHTSEHQREKRDSKEESRVGSRSSRSRSQTPSDRDERASENTNRTNKLSQKRESYSEVGSEVYKKEGSSVRSKSPRPHSQESQAERNESGSLTVKKDVDKKKDLDHINDHDDGDIKLHNKRHSVDSAASREYGGQTQISSRKSSPKRRNEEHDSVADGNASVNKNGHNKVEEEGYLEKQRIGSSRRSSQSLVYDNTPSTPEASEKDLGTRTNRSKDGSNKFTGSSGHDSDLRRMASKSSMNSTQSDERNGVISSGSPRHGNRNGVRSDSGKTRMPEETSSRNFRPPSGVLSSHSRNRDVDSEDGGQNKDVSRRHSILDEQPEKADPLGDTYTVRDYAVLESLGNMTFRKSDPKENDELSPYNAEARDSPTRNSAHGKNGDGFSNLNGETSKMASGNSAHAKNDDDNISFKIESRDLVSRNSAHSKNGDIPNKAESRDLVSRNSIISKNGDIPNKAESRDLASRNSAHSKNGGIPNKAESRDLVSRNSIISKNGDIPNKAESRDLASRNSAHNKNGDIPNKAESRDLASRNSAHSKNGDIPNKAESRDLVSRNSIISKNGDIPNKAESRDLASRNSAHSKNGDIPNKAESRDLASRNSAHSKNNDEFSTFQRETGQMGSKNSAHDKNDDDHIPYKIETRDLVSRNSIISKNGDIPNREEARDLVSRNSAHSKNEDEFSTFKKETSNIASRNSAHTNIDDEFSAFIGESRKIDSRNSGLDKNDVDHIPFKIETRDLVSRNSAISRNENIPNKAESRDLVSRNSAHSKNGDIPNKAESRDLASRISAHSKNEDEFSAFNGETSNIVSRKSAPKNDDDHIPFKAETRDLPSRNSAHSKNDEHLSHFKPETKDIISKNSADNPNIEDMFSF